MNQDKISNLIKEIREKNNLTQKEFAAKYGVTFQAVSKWENGKNIPDLAILKQICNDNNLNLDDFLEGKKKNNKKYIIPIIMLILVLLVGFILIKRHNNEFEHLSITTTCKDFKLYGSIAYNDNKTSINIAKITYCGDEKDELFSKIDCNFYELDNKNKTLIDSYTYNDKEISLDEFLNNVTFNVEHYSKSCKMYKEGNLLLEIEATNNGNTTYYKIPLELNDNCVN